MVLALDIHNLHKRYQNGVVALKGIDLQVKPGDFFGLLGPNGAGKSTTIGILTSLVRKTEGQVRIFGTDLDHDLEKAKSYLGLVPQEFNFNQFEKVFDIVINQAGYYGIPRKTALPKVEHYLTKMGLWHRRFDIARNLSGGMKRRLMIARALVHEPKMLILDEPTAGADIEIRRHLWSFLREINHQGTTLILTTHYLEEVEQLCKNLAIINEGAIVEHTSVKKLLTRLDQEHLILDLKKPVDHLPQIPNLFLLHLDAYTLEARVTKGMSLNKLFEILTQHGLAISSMRNKENRLEALFLQLVSNNGFEDSNPISPEDEHAST